MKLRYELLVVDLDGTLLDVNGNVSKRNREALAAIRDAGVEIIIATGRALSESREALSAIGHDGLVVAAGGSLLCDAASGRTIDRRTLPADTVHLITRKVLEDGHKVLVLKDADTAGFDYLAVGPGTLDPASQWWFERLRVQVRYVDDLGEDSHPEDSLRAGAVASGDRIEPLARDLSRMIGDRCLLQHWSAVTASHAIGSSTHLLEIFVPGVSKWSMVEAYCGRREIDLARVAAIGDGLNDVELIQNAALGIAMANSDARVTAVADQITADHNTDGVAEAIGRILSGEW